MYFLYNFTILVFLIISPLIFLIRIIKKKEHPNRFLEKYCIYKKTKNNSKVIWLHAASVGELISVIPIIKKLESKKSINKILLTTSTVSSAKIYKKHNFKKTIHKFFPIDSNYLTKKFINFWKPKTAIFVDSEIWPNMIKNLNKKKIPIIIINGRITEKSFKRWKSFPKFAEKVFSKINLALPSNIETSKYLKILGVKNIKHAGNLKFFGKIDHKQKQFNTIKKKFKKYKIFCAASTHKGEEELICKLHLKLREKIKDLITIIIPRHITRIEEIKNNLTNNNLNFVEHSSESKLNRDTDIYLVDVYGETYKFFYLSNVTFMGGSIINHGGQNPLEAARLGNFILSGPNIKNFKEIYNFLEKNKIYRKTQNLLIMEKFIKHNLNKKLSNHLREKITNIGNEALNKNLSYIQKYIK